MKFSIEAVEKMAEIMVQEMNRVGADNQGMREVETAMRELVREVGAQALGSYLEQQAEQLQEQGVICACGETMTYVCRRSATVVSVFGRVSYRRGYYLCEVCHARQAPLDRRLGIEAGQVTAGLAELLALAGVEIAFEEASRWLEHYLLFRVSDNTLRKETERFGELQEVQETEWKAKSQEEAWLQQRQRELGKQPGRLYGSLDGVMARTQEYRLGSGGNSAFVSKTPPSCEAGRRTK
jgi:hypothetical protein